jgi:hypothetical protein
MNEVDYDFLKTKISEFISETAIDVMFKTDQMPNSQSKTDLINRQNFNITEIQSKTKILKNQRCFPRR